MVAVALDLLGRQAIDAGQLGWLTVCPPMSTPASDIALTIPVVHHEVGWQARSGAAAAGLHAKSWSTRGPVLDRLGPSPISVRREAMSLTRRLPSPTRDRSISPVSRSPPISTTESLNIDRHWPGHEHGGGQLVLAQQRQCQIVVVAAVVEGDAGAPGKPPLRRSSAASCSGRTAMKAPASVELLRQRRLVRHQGLQRIGFGQHPVVHPGWATDWCPMDTGLRTGVQSDVKS